MAMVVMNVSRRVVPRNIHRLFSVDSKRVFGITVNPESAGSRIQPGGTSVMKLNAKTGEERPILVERALGNFWMISDLGKTKKPTLSNTQVIPENDASLFPTLTNLNVLADDEVVDLPSYFIRDNRTQDPAAECTLVAVAYKDYGNKVLSTWANPFEEAFGPSNQRAKVMRVCITEGKWTKLFLSRFMKSSFRKVTPPQQYPRTLLCFGPDEDELKLFNDALRMHNTLTGYVFLLDGLGRVRFAGSGEATEEDTKRLITFAKEITPHL